MRPVAHHQAADARASGRDVLAIARERLRAGGPRRLAAGLLPRRVDELLYGVAVDDALPPHGCTVAAVVTRHDAASPSGDPALDARLTGRRRCYVARVGGVAAHRSWLHFDVLVPSLFGFPAGVPVVGDCTTEPAFRGLRLYPLVLAHIVADLRARGDAASLHVLVAPDNLPSIRGIERAGFRRLGHLRGIRVGPVLVRLPTRAGTAPGAIDAATR